MLTKFSSGRYLRWVLVVLLLASATVFAVGVAVERSQRDQHQGEATGAAGSLEGSPGGEALEGGQGTPSGGTPSVAPETIESSGEKLFGMNTETIPIVAAFVAVSLLLAAAIIAFRSSPVLLVVAVFGFLAAAFDIREAIHQANESRHAVVILSSVTAGLHVVLGLLAAAIALSRTRLASRFGGTAARRSSE